MTQPTARFRAFRRFNDPSLSASTGVRARLDESTLEHFPGDGLPARLARSLARHRALPIKELFESFEFFERTRRRMRAPQVADLCCGHGLTGLLYATFERSVEGVTLLDRRRPVSYDAVFAAITAVAPWVAAKVRYLEQPVEGAAALLEPGVSVVAVHACGVRTDRVIDQAIALGSPLAVMPCCYARTGATAPKVLRRELGAELMTDVDRTYRLEAAGYVVDWAAIPATITEKNRILVATLPPA